MLFYFVGQGFACALINIPIAIFRDKIGGPSWAPYLIALLNGTVVAAVQMRPALETQRLGIAMPLFAVATMLSIPAFQTTSWLWQITSNESFLTIVAFWVLALLFASDIARRASSRS